MMNRIIFLNCPIDRLNINEVLDWMEYRIKRRIPSRIVTVNANLLWLMSRNPELGRIIREFELIVPEWAVIWGAQKLGIKIETPVYGIELLKAIFPWSVQKGFRIFLLGAKQNVLESLEAKLWTDFPNLDICGIQNGYFSKEDTENVIQQIKSAKPDILAVALGAPKQELWIDRYYQEIRVPISIGVGGSFDVISGIKKDTPPWARGHGLEWIYRTFQDPKAYLKRYLIINSWIIWNVFKESIKQKIKK